MMADPAGRTPPLTNEQRDLVATGALLAFDQAGRWRRGPTAAERADLIHDAAVDGLLTASRHWDPARGPFEACARCNIEGSVRHRLWRDRRRDATRPGMYHPDAEVLSAVADPGDDRAEADDREQRAADLARVQAAMASALTPREADVLRRVYGVGRPAERQGEVAIELGLSRSRVSAIAATAVTKLQRHLTPSA